MVQARSEADLGEGPGKAYCRNSLNKRTYGTIEWKGRARSVFYATKVKTLSRQNFLGIMVIFGKTPAAGFHYILNYYHSVVMILKKIYLKYS